MYPFLQATSENYSSSGMPYNKCAAVLVLTITGRGCALMDPSNSITYTYLAKRGSCNNDFLHGCPGLLFVGYLEQFADGELLKVIDVQHGWKTSERQMIPHISTSLVTAKLFLEVLVTLKEVFPENSQGFSPKIKDDGELARLLVIIWWVLQALHCAR